MVAVADCKSSALNGKIDEQATKMNRTVRTVDFVIRIAAVVVVSTLGMAMLLLVCAMGTATGTPSALMVSASIFAFGCLILALIILVHPADA